MEDQEEAEESNAAYIMRNMSLKKRKKGKKAKAPLLFFEKQHQEAQDKYMTLNI